MLSTRALTRLVLAAFAVGVLGACATTSLPEPRRMEAGDLKLMVGEWTGTSEVQGEVAVAILGVIYEAGSFFIAPRATPGAQQPGVMRIVDGKVLYEGAHSSGTMTFHETSTEWMWKWDGKTKIGNRAVRNELRRAK